MSHAVVNPDREELIQCPYDPVHMISQMRFPYHLIKCRKNHNGREYAQCPYDAKHVIIKARFQDHMKECDKRAIIEPQLVLDDARNLDLIIPESRARQIQATLTNEWDLEAPSAAATNIVVTQTVYNTFQSIGNNKAKDHEYSSFQPREMTTNHDTIPQNSSYSSRGNDVGQWNGGYNPYNTRPSVDIGYSITIRGDTGYNGRFDSVENGYSVEELDYSQTSIPRKPLSNGKGKSTGENQKPASSTSPSLCSYDNTPASSRYVEIRKPFSKTTSTSSNTSDTYNHQKSYGRGRATSRQAREDYSVLNTAMGPGSYTIQSLPEKIDSYNPPPVASFGRGRGAGDFADQPMLRRPGMNSKGGREALEKEKQKLHKKIRETKQLEERLARGEILEDNQVSKLAKLASMQNELNKICKQLQNLE